MIITVPDEKVQKLISDELAKIGKTTWRDSIFETAVRSAVNDIVKEQVKELVKANPGQLDALKQSITENLSTQMEQFGKSIASSIVVKLNEGIEQAFKTYDD